MHCSGGWNRLLTLYIDDVSCGTVNHVAKLDVVDVSDINRCQHRTGAQTFAHNVADMDNQPCDARSSLEVMLARSEARNNSQH